MKIIIKIWRQFKMLSCNVKYFIKNILIQQLTTTKIKHKTTEFLVISISTTRKRFFKFNNYLNLTLLYTLQLEMLKYMLYVAIINEWIIIEEFWQTICHNFIT